MSDFLLETIRAIVVFVIFFYLWWVGNREHISKQTGWGFIMSGFGLVLFGMLIDITDEFPGLDKYVIIGDTEIQAFLEKVVGYLVGFLLLSIGFWKWMPTVVSLNKTKLELQKSHEQLEEKVRERTLDLQKSKEHLAVTLLSIGDGVISTDSEGKITLINMIAEELTGWSQADSLDRPLHEVFHIINIKTKEPAVNPVERVLKSGEIVSLANHTILIAKDGTEYQIADSAAPIRDDIGNITGTVLVFRDVTKEYRMREKLQQNEKLLNSVFESIQDGVSILNLDLTIRYVNSVMNKWYTEKLPLEGKKCFQCYHNADKPCDPCPTLRCLESGKTEMDVVPGPPGSDVKWLELYSYPIRNAEGGKISGVAEFVRDITKHKQAEEDRERLMSAIEQAAETIVITDSEGAIQYVNPAFERITGYTRLEAMGENPRLLKSGEHDDTFYRDMWTTLLQGEVWSGHLISKKKDGSLFEEEATISPVKNNKGQITNFVAVKRDVSREVSLERQLLQAMKMEAIGNLAGGIAHDFNNILTAIMGYSELAKLDIPADGKAIKDIDEVLKAGRRATDLVQQILTFSRKSDQRLKPIEPHVIIKEALKMLRASLPSTITIQEDIDSQCGKVMADSTNIHQIIVNLCTNSLHAMENEKGVLGISLYRKEISDEEIVGEPDVSSGPFIVLQVSDTGHGMHQKTIERIFDPYYTSKEVGKGTGLGLAVIHGVVKNYHGFIRIESELGKGTTFYVHIPVLQKDTSIIAEPETSEPLSTGTERILVVDDESMIVNLNKTVLEQLGYKVTATTKSLEALKKIRTDPDQFDLIITDQTMPNLTGAELAQEILEIKPSIPIILCTGYSSVLSEKDTLSIGIKKYARKPVDRTTLAKIVRQVLDEN
jgi:PAS domain S-box-containing protein